MVSHLHQLQYLAVEDCKGVEQIVQGDILPDNALQKLSRLILEGLPELTSICMPLPVLKSLEEIYASNCPKLKKLPPLCSATQIAGYIMGPTEWLEGMEWEDDHSKSIYSTILLCEEEDDEEEEEEEEAAWMEEGDEEALELQEEDEEDALEPGEHRGVANFLF